MEFGYGRAMTHPLCRPARPSDVPAILSFIRELATAEGRPEAVLATEPLLHDLLFGARPVAEAVMVLDPISGASVGYAWICFITATFQGRLVLCLEDLCITGSARGKGLGARMMEWLAKLAVERGCVSMDWSVVEGNVSAARFYERLGARPKLGSISYRLHGSALKQLGRPLSTTERD